LGDDVFREDNTTIAFESQIASLCGHEAAAFVITGTMANQLALRTLLTQPPHSILADTRAHIIHFEAGGAGFMSGASVQTVRPSNGKYLTLDDIAARAVITDDVHKCPTRVISLKNTTGGNIIPVAELRRISTWARRRDIKLHLDGARIWEVVTAEAGSIPDYAATCDLMSLDFSKNLGAPMGAMVVGSSRLIAQLRRIRKSIGGGMRQSDPLAAAAKIAVEEQFGTGIWDGQGKLRAVHGISKRVGNMWVEMGGRLLRDVETNQVWVDLRKAGVSVEQWIELGRKHGVQLDGKRIVFHHQVGMEAVRRLGFVFEEALRVEPRVLPG
jgi:threonine aldolase